MWIKRASPPGRHVATRRAGRCCTYRADRHALPGRHPAAAGGCSCIYAWSTLYTCTVREHATPTRSDGQHVASSSREGRPAPCVKSPVVLRARRREMPALVQLAAVLTVLNMGAATQSQAKSDAAAAAAGGFEAWRRRFGRTAVESYPGPAAEAAARRNWARADVAIAAHNRLGLWQMGHTQFSDLTDEEFRRRVGGGRRPAAGGLLAAPCPPPSQRYRPPPLPAGLPAAMEIPASLDWVARGKVTAVKDQGHCGACSQWRHPLLSLRLVHLAAGACHSYQAS